MKDLIKLLAKAPVCELIVQACVFYLVRSVCIEKFDAELSDEDVDYSKDLDIDLITKKIEKAIENQIDLRCPVDWDNNIQFRIVGGKTVLGQKQ